jgi:hypothetical protein
VFSGQSSLLHHELGIAKSLLCLLLDVVMSPILQLCSSAIRELASHPRPVGPEQQMEFSKTPVFVFRARGPSRTSLVCKAEISQSLLMAEQP